MILHHNTIEFMNFKNDSRKIKNNFLVNKN